MMKRSEDFTAEQTLASLLTLAQYMTARGAFIVTQQSTSSPPDLLRLSVTEKLRKEFLNSDIENANFFANRTLIEYMSSRALPDGHLMWANASDVNLLATLDVEDEASKLIPTYGEEAIASHNLKMTVTTSSIKMPDGISESVTCYRITRDTARLAKAKRLAAIFRGGGFDKLDDEVILFNRAVDAITFNGYVFFSAKGVFERAFGFIEDLKRQASKTFEELIGILRIEGMEDFRRAATSDINMMAKMASIRRKIDGNDSYAKAVNMDNLLSFIDINEHVEVETAGRGKRRALVFKSSPKTRFKILKLLDDDFLTSKLTEMDYLIDSKGDPLRKV